MKIKNIDTELWQRIKNSPFSKIAYEELLANDPSKIREEELKLSLKELPETPQQLAVEDIWIPSSDKGRNIRLRTYKPKGKQNLPILLYFHGGAFIYGTPEQYDFILFRLALDANAMIVSVDYRLAPEHPFPAAMQDGYDTLLWLAENADLIGADQHHITIAGSSAGATIAASVTHLSRDRKEVVIRHQYLLYPPMSHLLDTPSMQELANTPMQTKQAAEWMWKHYLQNRIHHPPKYAVPLLEENFQGLPGTTIVVCELDPLKDEGKLYASKLQEAAIPVDLLEIKGAVHAFDFFPCTLSDNFYTQQIELFKQILVRK